eukprot:6214684-Pleurochrysis_carterae.AAC.1
MFNCLTSSWHMLRIEQLYATLSFTGGPDWPEASPQTSAMIAESRSATVCRCDGITKVKLNPGWLEGMN